MKGTKWGWVSELMLANSGRSDRVEPKSGRDRSLCEFRKLLCVDPGACLDKYSCRDSHGLVDWGSWEGCHWRWVISSKLLSYQAPLEWRWGARQGPRRTKLCALSLFTCSFYPPFLGFSNFVLPSAHKALTFHCWQSLTQHHLLSE